MNRRTDGPKKMTISRRYLMIPLLAAMLTLSACGPDAEVDETGTSGPTLTLSMTRVPAKEWVDVVGTGFTPHANVTSHLERPDGTEFPELPIMTDANGEFTHEIDSLLLLVGPHQMWVLDDTTGQRSNVAEFIVTREQPE